MPWGVFVGVFCQFTIMPLVGFALTKVFAFPEEIAAGIILIGCCSSGLASNVMVYLARGNLALSITLTAVTTLVAPVMTPLWMKRLGRHTGRRLELLQDDAGDHQDRDRADRRGVAARLFEVRLAVGRRIVMGAALAAAPLVSLPGLRWVGILGQVALPRGRCRWLS